MIQAGHFQGGNNNCLAIDGKCISFGRNQSKYIKIHLKNPKNNNKKRNVSFADARMCALYVGDEALVWKVQPCEPRSIFTKAFLFFFCPIGGSADPGSLIRSLWSIRFQSLLKRQNVSRISLRTVLLEQRHKKTFR